MRRVVVVTSVVVGLGLGGLPATSAWAQTRVVVPIIVRQPSPGASTSAGTSVQVTTRTVSPQAGVTRTQVTIKDTTGINGYSSGRARPAEPGVSRVTIKDTTGINGYASGRARPAEPGVARVTVKDTTGVNGYASGRARSAEPGGSRTEVTIQDTTGMHGFSSRPLGLTRAGRAVAVGGNSGRQEAATVDGGPTVVVPFPITLRPAPGGQPRSLVITTDAPIDTPIVILGP